MERKCKGLVRRWKVRLKVVVVGGGKRKRKRRER